MGRRKESEGALDSQSPEFSNGQLVGLAGGAAGALGGLVVLLGRLRQRRTDPAGQPSGAEHRTDVPSDGSSRGSDSRPSEVVADDAVSAALFRAGAAAHRLGGAAERGAAAAPATRAQLAEGAAQVGASLKTLPERAKPLSSALAERAARFDAGAAVANAGATATAGSAVLRRQIWESPRIAEGKEAAMARTRVLAERVGSRRKKARPATRSIMAGGAALGDRVRVVADVAKERAGSLPVDRTVGRAREFGTAVADVTRERAASLPPAGTVLGKTRASVGALAETAREGLPETGQRLGQQLGDLVDSGSDLVASLRERAPELGHELMERANKDLFPTLQEVSRQATGSAAELWEAGRMRAGVAGEAAQHELGPRAARVLAASGGRAEEVVERAGSAAARAGEASKHAKEVTVSTSKDATAALLWAGAAVALVYYVLLDEERRRQLLSTAKTAFGQIRELVRDFQGYDEEF